jgi:hypothetical protein
MMLDIRAIFQFTNGSRYYMFKTYPDRFTITVATFHLNIQVQVLSF